MTEKHFLVSRFYNSLVAKARQIFEMTRLDAQNWLRWALNPLDMQIKGHEQVLTKRIENFKTIRDNINSVEDRMKHLEKQQAVLQQQSQVLARIRRSLDGEALPEEEPAAQREAVQVA
jgi:predicted transcriptional regulator